MLRAPFFFFVVILAFTWSARGEDLKELELRLQLLETHRQVAIEKFERAKEMLENAQLRSRLLAQEEQAIKAKIEEMKKKPEAENKKE